MGTAPIAIGLQGSVYRLVNLTAGGLGSVGKADTRMMFLAHEERYRGLPDYGVRGWEILLSVIA